MNYKKLARVCDSDKSISEVLSYLEDNLSEVKATLVNKGSKIALDFKQRLSEEEKQEVAKSLTPVINEVLSLLNWNDLKIEDFDFVPGIDRRGNKYYTPYVYLSSPLLKEIAIKERNDRTSAYKVAKLDFFNKVKSLADEAGVALKETLSDVERLKGEPCIRAYNTYSPEEVKRMREYSDKYGVNVLAADWAQPGGEWVVAFSPKGIDRLSSGIR